MVSIDELSQILKTKISTSELAKLSAKNPPVENVVKILAGEKSGTTTDELKLALLKSYLPDKIPLAKGLNSLIQILSTTSNIELTSQTKETLIAVIKSLFLQEEEIDENLLKKIITRTGLNYEADLKKLVLSKTLGAVKGAELSEKQKGFLINSIKGQLIKLVQEIETKLKNIQQMQNHPQIKELQAMLKNIKVTLSNIELNQIMNYYSKQEDGFFQFQIPYSMSETIHLYIKDNSKENKQKGKNKKDISLIFLLNLKGMGNIRIDVQMFDKSMSCHFYAGGKNVSEFITEMLPELKRNLEKTYDVTDMSCSVKDKKFFEEETPEKKLFQKKAQIISVKA